MTTKQFWKDAEAKAVEGLTGKARKEAQSAFYNANKAAIRAAFDAEAIAAFAALKAKDAEIEQMAVAKGLKAWVTANVGYVKGTSWDDVVLVSGNTFACKDVLKAHGAIWNGVKKAWVFASVQNFTRAMQAL